MLQQLLHGLVSDSAQAEGPGALGMVVPYLLIFVALYFIMIRPQQKEQKKKESFLAQLKKGDDVLLQSGLFGKVAAVAETDVTLEISPNVKVKVLKSAVVGAAPAGKAAEPEAPKAEK